MRALGAEERGKRMKRLLPFFAEFVKFSAAFLVIIAVALLVLRFAGASGELAAVLRFW